MKTLFEELKAARPVEIPEPGVRNELLQVRLDANTLYRLDRIVAHARGNGFTKYSRSFIAREAIEAYIAGVEEQIPEVMGVIVRSFEGAGPA